jgi:hypothetical protein
VESVPHWDVVFVLTFFFALYSEAGVCGLFKRLGFPTWLGFKVYVIHKSVF